MFSAVDGKSLTLLTRFTSNCWSSSSETTEEWLPETASMRTVDPS